MICGAVGVTATVLTRRGHDPGSSREFVAGQKQPWRGRPAPFFTSSRSIGALSQLRLSPALSARRSVIGITITLVPTLTRE
jgi:hypothetical protein